MLRHLCYTVPVFLVVIALGCAQPGPPLTEVKGRATLDGKPLDGAVIRFNPLAETPGHGGIAVADGDGKFSAIAGGADKRPGLPAGKYKVLITRHRRPDGSAPRKDVPDIVSDAVETVPDPYSSSRDTPLTATIGTSSETIDFHLKSP